MRIMIIAGSLPTRRYPMNGVFEFDQAKALSSLGHEVIYTAIDLRSIRRLRRWGRYGLRLADVNIEVVSIPIGHLGRRILSVAYSQAAKRLFDLVSDKFGPPDIVHAHFIGSLQAVTRRLPHCETPLIITEHSSLVHTNALGAPARRERQSSYRRASRVVAVSQSLANVISNEYGVAAKVIPNIVDTRLFKFTAASDLQRNGFIFCCTSNLVAIKRTELLVRAFALLQQADLGARLEVFGDGPERSRIEQVVEECHVQESVSLHGRVSREQLSSWYSRAQAFVLLSASETFGVAHAEALAAGLPVVATACGGPEDFLDNSNSILVDPAGNAAEVAHAMRAMIDNYPRFHRERISDEARRRFSPEIVATDLTDLYRAVAEGI